MAMYQNLVSHDVYGCPPTRSRLSRWLLKFTLLAHIAVSAPVMADCKGLVLHAHRGTPGLPENSLSAIRGTLLGGWDGVEIDLQQLRDQQWVIHHDPVLGRTTSLARHRAADLDSDTWREVRLKDRQGNVTAEAAPFLDEVLKATLENNDKVINAEIKQGFRNCTAAQQAVAAMTQGRPSGQWFLTSIERRHLQCARRADPHAYLGVIVLDPQAIALQDQRSARVAQKLTAPLIDSAWLTRLQRDVAPPVGIHVDINTLTANPQLLNDAKGLGIPVFSYNLGDDRDHVQALRHLAKNSGLWPSGAIINSQPEAFCDLLSRP